MRIENASAWSNAISKSNEVSHQFAIYSGKIL